MYFTRWNPFCQIVSAENIQDLRKFILHEGTERSETGRRLRRQKHGTAMRTVFGRKRGQAFLTILDQESFRATVRLNTGCSLEWSFGSE